MKRTKSVLYMLEWNQPFAGSVLFSYSKEKMNRARDGGKILTPRMRIRIGIPFHFYFWLKRDCDKDGADLFSSLTASQLYQLVRPWLRLTYGDSFHCFPEFFFFLKNEIFPTLKHKTKTFIIALAYRSNGRSYFPKNRCLMFHFPSN